MQFVVLIFMFPLRTFMLRVFITYFCVTGMCLFLNLKNKFNFSCNCNLHYDTVIVALSFSSYMIHSVVIWPFVGTWNRTATDHYTAIQWSVHWLLMGVLLRTGRAVALPSPLLAIPNQQPTHQRPVYQLHIIRCGTIIASALYRVKTSTMDDLIK